MEKTNFLSLKKYLLQKAFEERIKNRMYKVLGEREIEEGDKIITVEILKYKNGVIKESFKNIRKIL